MKQNNQSSVISHPLLLQHFEKVIDTPDTIPRLRRFILDLAVRGKLVEPACRQAGKTPATLPPPVSNKWWAYVIQCEDGSFYKGHTDNLPRRWKQHCAGTAANWTKAHPPKEVFYWEQCGSKETAIKREKYLKSGSGREWFQREVVDAPEAWEPAAELLKRIDAEKKRLVAAKKIKKPKALPPIEADEVPFEVPNNWIWTRLGETADWGAGSTPSRGHSEYYDGGITWLKSGELNDCETVRTSIETVTELALEKCSFRLNKPGDVLIAMYGATIGKVAILSEKAVTNQAVCGCSPHTGLFNRYLFDFLLAQRAYFHSMSEGGAQPNISKVKILNFPFPLPPLAEQKRIVAKVDELMALCDRLEAAQAEKNNQRKRLVAATHHQINLPDGKADTTDDRTTDIASFLFHPSNFKLHTSRPQDVSLLRQTILNLAVRGKLVPQDPNDEPAAELLKRIAAEKELLVKEKKIRKSKALPDIEKKEIPFEIPQSWSLVRLIDAYDVRDGTHDTPQYVDAGIPLVTSKNLRTKSLDLSNVKFISEKDHEQICKRSRVDMGDILFAMIGTIGNPIVVEIDPNFSIKNVALFKYYSPQDSVPHFLCSALELFSADMTKKAAGGLQPFVSLTSLRKYVIPLPPLAEQKRIVAKVDELMALCDALEAQLATSQPESQQLLEACLNEAIA